MSFGCYVAIPLIAVLIWHVIKAARQKEWLCLLWVLFLLPCIAWFLACAIYGGSPAVNAASQYSGYEPGHFYLYDTGHPDKSDSRKDV